VGVPHGPGAAVVLRHPQGVALKLTHFKAAEGGRPLTFLAKGSQTAMPPSRHKQGGRYAWLAGHGPDEIALAPAPAWLVETLRNRSPSPVPAGETADGEAIPEGRRNVTLASMGGSMRKRGFGEDAIKAALASENESRCEPPLSAEDVESIARSVSRYEPDALAGVTITALNGAAPKRDATRTAADVASVGDLIAAGASVEWFWPGWVQVGVLTAVAAEGGKGKTRFCADLLRRIRRRLTWPDGTPIHVPADARALWVIADNNHDEMASLAKAFGIEAAVWINAWKEEPYGGVMLDDPADVSALDRRIELVKPVMVVVDTVGNSTDRNLSRQEEAKAYYQPLQLIARRHRCAVLCLTHLNATGKFLGRRVLEKVRVAIQMTQPLRDDERRRLWVAKTNSLRPEPLGVIMGDHGNEYDTNPPEAPEEAEYEPGKAGRPATAAGLAQDWLRQELSCGARRVGNTVDRAKEAQITVGSLYRARDALGVEQYEMQGVKWWRLAKQSPGHDPGE
jgi:hypothetical protein